MKLESIIPIIAPAPPAVVIALQLYDEVQKATNNPDWWALAALAAVLGMVGTIGAEMLAYKKALQALAERELAAALVALVGALVVSGLIVWAIWRSEDSRPLVVAVLVSIVGYLIGAIGDYLNGKKARRQSSVDNSLAQTKAQAELEQARAKRAAAEARRAKFESGTGRVSSVSTGQMDTEAVDLDPDLLAKARAFFDANPEASARAFAAHAEVSPTTASKYKKKVNA